MKNFKLTSCYKILIKIIWLLGVFLTRVNSQNDTETSLITTAAAKTTTMAAASLPVVKCGNMQKMADECFRDLPPHLMQFLQPKIAINEQEIASKCTVFNRGMRCFDEYTTRCLANASVNILKNNVEGARNFFNKFCSDPAFQQDYIRNKDCFSYIREDWERCHKTFQGILTEKLHVERTNVTDKFMEFCCARHAYEECIYNSARFKCYPHSVNFARETAKMLSEEKQFSNCRQYEDSLCRARTALSHRIECWRLLLLSMLLIQLLLRRQS